MSDPRMIPADEARRLREAATPGPWHVMDNGFGGREILGTSPDRPGVFPILGEFEEEGDADLARLTPDLAYTVVEQAETIQTLSRLLAGAEEAATERATQIDRVREAMKALRDYYIDREARSRERLEYAADEREKFHLARFAHNHRRTHEELTRILEGNNDG